VLQVGQILPVALWWLCHREGAFLAPRTGLKCQYHIKSNFFRAGSSW
jgi:hypothetical protein